MKDHEGKIDIDDPIGKQLCFTSDKFWIGYLWKVDNDIYISLIASKGSGKGYLSSLFNRIEELGFNIKVPNPVRHMQEILKKKNFKKNYEKHNMCDEMVEVWSK